MNAQERLGNYLVSGGYFASQKKLEFNPKFNFPATEKELYDSATRRIKKTPESEQFIRNPLVHKKWGEEILLEEKLRNNNLPETLQATSVQALGRGSGQSGMIPSIGSDGTRISPLTRDPITNLTSAFGPTNSTPMLQDLKNPNLPSHSLPTPLKRDHEELVSNTAIPITETEYEGNRFPKYDKRIGNSESTTGARGIMRQPEANPEPAALEELPDEEVPLEELPPEELPENEVPPEEVPPEEEMADASVPEVTSQNPLGASSSITLDPAQNDGTVQQEAPVEGAMDSAIEGSGGLGDTSVPVESSTSSSSLPPINVYVNSNNTGVKSDAPQPMQATSRQDEILQESIRTLADIKKTKEDVDAYIRKEKELLDTQSAVVRETASFNPHQEKMNRIAARKAEIFAKIQADAQQKKYAEELALAESDLYRLEHPEYFQANQSGDTHMLENDRLELMEQQRKADLAEVMRTNQEAIQKILEAVQVTKEKTAASQQTDDRIKAIQDAEKEKTRKLELAVEDKLRAADAKQKETERKNELYLERLKEKEVLFNERQKEREEKLSAKHAEETAARQKETEQEKKLADFIAKLSKKSEEDLKKKQALIDEQAYKFTSHEQRTKDAELVRSYEKRLDDLRAEKDNQAQIRSLRDEFNSKEEKRQAAELAELKQKIGNPYKGYRDQYGNGESGPSPRRHRHSQSFFDVINSLKNSEPDTQSLLTSKKKISKKTAKKRLKRKLKKFVL